MILGIETPPGERPARERAAPAFIGLVALALAACGPAEGGAAGLAGDPDDGRPHGIVMLVLDTVRADRLTPYDAALATTPTLAALAARGATFEQAQSAAPWTVPSVASLWTGLLPSEHGAGVIAEGRRSFERLALQSFDPAHATLPQRLGDLGYKTYARIANELLDMDCFTAGFDAVEFGHDAADGLVDWAEARLPALAREPFFLYLHFMDAHVPLDPDDETVERFLPFAERRDALRLTRRDAQRWGSFRRAASLGPEFDEFRVHKEAMYAAALWEMDAEIARLLAVLERAGLLADTLIVVTSDHGEELWDHWALQQEAYQIAPKEAFGTGHGHTLFEELLRVPLIVAGPGVTQGLRIDTRVHLADLGATVLELAAAGSAPGLGGGASFADLLEGRALPPRSLYSEGLANGYEKRALVDPDGFKLIRATHPGERDLLFDLTNDPREARDLLAEHPERAAELRAQIDALAEALAERRLEGGGLEELDLDALKHLGYIDDGDEEE
jgi:arylsulfatase A-like enzyme